MTDDMHWFYLPRTATWFPTYVDHVNITKADIEWMCERHPHRILPLHKGPKTPPEDYEMKELINENR